MAQLLSLYQWQSKSNNLGQSKSYQLSEKVLFYSFLQQKNDDAFRESWEEIHFNIIDVRWRFLTGEPTSKIKSWTSPENNIPVDFFICKKFGFSVFFSVGFPDSQSLSRNMRSLSRKHQPNRSRRRPPRTSSWSSFGILPCTRCIWSRRLSALGPFSLKLFSQHKL